MGYCIETIVNAACLKRFRCGIRPMDDFIQDGLNLSIENHYCRAYIVKEDSSDDVVALFALSFE